MGWGWPVFSENALLMYQQDLQLGPYFVKWQLAGPEFPLNILQNNYGGPILGWSKFPKDLQDLEFDFSLIITFSTICLLKPVVAFLTCYYR